MKSESCKAGKHYYLDWGGDPRFKACLFCGTMPGLRLLRPPRPPRAVPLLLFGHDTPPISAPRNWGRAQRKAWADIRDGRVLVEAPTS